MSKSKGYYARFYEMENYYFIRPWRKFLVLTLMCGMLAFIVS